MKIIVKFVGVLIQLNKQEYIYQSQFEASTNRRKMTLQTDGRPNHLQQNHPNVNITSD